MLGTKNWVSRFCLQVLFAIIVLGATNKGVISQPNNNPLAGKDSFLLENERIFDIKQSERPLVSFPIRELQPLDVSEIQFNAQEYLFPSKVEVPEVKMLPYTIAQDSQVYKLYANYLKVGLGQFITPYAELHLANPASARSDWSIIARHLSSHLDKIPLRQFREDKLDAQIGKEFSNYRWKVSGGGYNKSYNLYAHTEKLGTITDAVKDSLARMFTSAHALFEISNEIPLEKSRNHNGDDIKWSYNASIFSRNIWDSKLLLLYKNSQEYNLGTNADIGYQFAPTLKVGIQPAIEFSTGRISDTSQNRLVTNVLPYIQYHKGEFIGKAGVILSNFLRKQTQNNTNDFQVAPWLELSYLLSQQSLEIFAGYHSGYLNHTYHDILNENHYVNRNLRLTPTFESMNLFAGVRGVVSARWDYQLKGFFKNQQDKLMYIGYDTATLIKVAYAPEVQIFGANAAVSYSVNRVWQVGGSLIFNQFLPQQTKAVFGITPYQMRLFGKWQGVDHRLTVHPDFILYGKTPMGFKENGTVAYRPIQTDLSLAADYRITDRLNAFVQTHNLLGSRFYRWYNYPERRWNFLAGLGFIF